MKRRLSLLFFLSISFTAWSQEEKVISDSTVFIAAIKNATALYQSTSLASDQLKQYHERETVAVVSLISDATDYLFVIDDTLSGYIPLMDAFMTDDKLNYLRTRGNEGGFIRMEVAQKTAQTLKELRRREAVAALKKLESYTKQGLLLSDWSFYEPDDVTGAVEVNFTIINPAKKKIKYVWFTLVAYNAVGDRTGDYIHGLKPVTLQGIGPVEQWSEAKWSFERVWYNETIDCVKITQIKVQYMDGSSRLFDKPNLILGDGVSNVCKY